MSEVCQPFVLPARLCCMAMLHGLSCADLCTNFVDPVRLCWLLACWPWLFVCLPVACIGAVSARSCVRPCKVDMGWIMALQLFEAAVSGPRMRTMMRASLGSMRCTALVYVQDTDQFCHQTLCDPTFVHYVSANFLCWGGDVRKSDAFTVSQLSNFQTFCFTAAPAHLSHNTKQC